MTYQFLKTITSGLLTGDNKLPTENETVLGLLSYALTTTATLADSLHLMTLDTTGDVLRLAHGDYLIRRPSLPEFDSDVIDIDDELGYAVARYIAGMLSRDKGGVHNAIAERIILDYNAKVYEIIEQMQQEAIAAEIVDQYTITDNSVFSL